ncbi:hypothetical protein CC1G_01931 [Coprinopsis cinerea okayama7|uniref:VanZ-like domain-containing protein n=1 Tax=Coprinopsis cinerea (strain Okayama-7 / 130 / ATCC MYA-4618 / FGSC 9003) TaxID=240176 RepID=A8N601_COPC7|nr:hypothetical protein CC1G_01931 [Coprinopsis cinerea okayama7\|eukprot:XP_001830295.2 hypothetical protein CC1G_01931 [Coprinopsis cinerea okayama7\
MILLAFLGFTNVSKSLPLNTKLLHFFCFALATTVFYFIIDVEEQARRIWFWRYSSLIFTTVICFFCGGILSEFVQAALPYKDFDLGDIVANLLGSSVGLFAGFHLEKYYRRRREIARLYRPLNAEYSDEEEDVFSAGTVLLPTHTRPPKSANKKSVRFADDWNDQPHSEEVFDIGHDSDSDEEGDSAGPSSHPSKQSTTSADATNNKADGKKLVEADS